MQSFSCFLVDAVEVSECIEVPCPRSPRLGSLDLADRGPGDSRALSGGVQGEVMFFAKPSQLEAEPAPTDGWAVRPVHKGQPSKFFSDSQLFVDN